MSRRSGTQDQEDYKAAVKSAVLDEQAFGRLVLSGQIARPSPPWEKVSIRPVLIRGRRHWQFSYFDASRNIVSNFTRKNLIQPLEEVLAMPFGHIEVQSTGGGLHIRLTRKGRVLMTRGKPAPPAEPVDLIHNRPKDYLLRPADHGPFLRAIGVADSRGQVRPTMQGKFAQVNEFLRVIEQTVGARGHKAGPVFVVDCGCGSAYLTFAAFYFLRELRGMDVRVAGIDAKSDLIDKCVALREELGWQGLELSACTIADYSPPRPVDVVLSLHACDTATDEAIARGVQWGSSVILAAPCCQHELHHKLQAEPFRSLLRHGILRERLADLLTDAFRALALRIMGYRTAVVEFVSPEHTAKNLMIRAEAGLAAGQGEFVREYKDLRDFWQVRPVLEELLGEAFQRRLSAD